MQSREEGAGRIPNSIQYLIGSLGGCVGVKILLALSDNSIVPEELTSRPQFVYGEN